MPGETEPTMNEMGASLMGDVFGAGTPTTAPAEAPPADPAPGAKAATEDGAAPPAEGGDEAVRAAAEKEAADKAAAAAEQKKADDEAAKRAEEEAARASQDLDAKTGLPKRVRIEELSDQDRGNVAAATILAKSQKISFDEAYKRVTGAVPGQAKADPPPPAEPAAGSIEAIESELAPVRTKLDEMAGEGIINDKQYRELQAQEAKLLAKLEVAQSLKAEGEKLEAQQAEAAKRETFKAEFDEHLAKAIELYPDAAKEDSDLYKDIGAELDKINADKNHPLHRVPDLPMILVPKLAALRGIAPQEKKAKDSDGSQPPKPDPIRPVSASARTALPPPGKDGAKDTFKERYESADTLDKLGAAISDELWGGKQRTEDAFANA